MNRLTTKNIAHYLLGKGFLDPEKILSGDFKVVFSQSRNTIFRINTGDPTGLFVKQLVQSDKYNNYLMQKDSTVHFLIHNHECYKKTAKHIPQYYGYDPDGQVMSMAYYVDAKNLHEVLLEQKEIKEEYLKQSADILASFHNVSINEVIDSPSARFLPQQLPWALRWDDRYASDKHPYTLFLKEQLELNQQITEVKDAWKYSTLNHGDIKWVNFVVDKKSDHLKLIDWEIADFGDPFWDIGGMFQSFISHWILTFDENSATHERIKSLDFFTFESALNGMRTFWKHYQAQSKLVQEQPEKSKIKAIQYTAIRMLQTAYEICVHDNKNKITTNSARITQMAAKMLASPEKYVNHFLNEEINQHEAIAETF